MGVLSNIKLSLANRNLQKEMNAHPRVLQPNKFRFDNIRSVGMIFEAGNAEDFELVKRYVIYLREHGKKVKVLGFFSGKEIPELTYSKLEYDFFSAKEVSWMGKPECTAAANFIGEPYDLLIDLNIHDHFCLRYISGMSKALFKVGKYQEDDTSIYDMMIDADNTKTVKYFLRQIDTYITMLNKSE